MNYKSYICIFKKKLLKLKSMNSSFFLKFNIDKINKINKKTFTINKNNNLVFCPIFQFFIFAFAN